ncbi:MAG: ferrochelatase [Gammaproteobacteria bacterium]|nr:ferrochelatase [Rhodocyclaceae bacterium]MBU3908717.1 ferrochelatase [Gammaproteobacteria bacterium]MBU3988839.1 ferrochelatase [Gammaproteobacteria bacterium]MBU4004745.1 ferrochelatase [Gammaproteobacteria bacterium]MBU4021348.1 ferrochelatase [Gammaproteobacteria bacterium]
MPRFRPEPKIDTAAAPRTAILLVNLGTPEAPTAPAVRRYLGEFLWDPRVVEIPRLVWWFILNGIILNTRPKKSAEKYAAIWMAEGSPLKVHTERQVKLLKGLLGQQGLDELLIDFAMRYGQPSIESKLDALKAAGATRILIVPLYPQFAASTTASVMDVVAGWMQRARNLPEISFVRDYHDHPGYLDALAASVREHWQANGRPTDNTRLLLSFHGLPQRSIELGDPYFDECQRTGQLLATRLGLPEGHLLVTFQSRFGPAKWLQPYTQPTLEELAKQGIERVDILCPGFAADCLETLEEIALECKAAFLGKGGKEFHYIPCLNERPDWIAALADIALNRLRSRD